jgi:DNA-binding transcriptional ArsR family regulator
MNTHKMHAKAFAALGHETRLELFLVLVQAGAAGLNVGQISRMLSLPPSTLAHHLTMLVQAELVMQVRKGRTVICRAHYAQMDRLIEYLTKNCCTGTLNNEDADAAEMNSLEKEISDV